MGRSSKQKISKETQTLNDTMDQLDLIDIYRTFHPKTMNFTFFSSAHGAFSRIDHILGHKSRLGKFKKKNWNNFKPLFWSQCSKIKCQLQEWVAFPFSRGSAQPRDWTQVSRIVGEFFNSWAINKIRYICRLIVLKFGARNLFALYITLLCVSYCLLIIFI